MTCGAHQGSPAQAFQLHQKETVIHDRVIPVCHFLIRATGKGTTILSCEAFGRRLVLEQIVAVDMTLLSRRLSVCCSGQARILRAASLISPAITRVALSVQHACRGSRGPCTARWPSTMGPELSFETTDSLAQPIPGTLYTWNKLFRRHLGDPVKSALHRR